MMKNLKTNNLFALIAVLLLVNLAACSTPPVAIAPVDAQRTLMVNNLERTYYLHIPEGLNDQQSVPLVFVFHGYQENSASARRYTGFDDIADANGFIVVYPDGSGSPSSRSWNASGCCGEALLDNVDETAFVLSIIADVETLVTLSPQNIYATGFSNGALLSYRLACEMSGTFAAIAPVAGAMMYTPCEPQQPVSLLHVHGMKDTVVPFIGGGSDIRFPAVEESLAAWKKLDGCSGEEQVEEDGVLTHTTYGVCKPGVSVELYAVTGIGHSWPSQYVAPISQIIWEFFAAHPKP